VTKSPEIERDLVQWTPRLWVLFVLALLVLQVAGLFLASIPVRARSSYPKSPRYNLAHGEFRGARVELDDPLLFATAHRDGFSGPAWMQPPIHAEKLFEALPPPAFLSFRQAQDVFPPFQLKDSPDLFIAPEYHLTPEPATVQTPVSPRFSTLRLVGPLASRGLMYAPELPLQTHNDVLSSSVVQLSVDRDGTVISAHLSESSGLKKADLDALALARQARFGPSDDPAREVDFGKLIFDWFALDFNCTNGVKR